MTDTQMHDQRGITSAGGIFFQLQGDLAAGAAPIVRVAVEAIVNDMLRCGFSDAVGVVLKAQDDDAALLRQAGSVRISALTAHAIEYHDGEKQFVAAAR